MNGERGKAEPGGERNAAMIPVPLGQMENGILYTMREEKL